MPSCHAGGAKEVLYHGALRAKFWPGKWNKPNSSKTPFYRVPPKQRSDEATAIFYVERNKGYTVMSNHRLRNKEVTLWAKGLCRTWQGRNGSVTTKRSRHILGNHQGQYRIQLSLTGQQHWLWPSEWDCRPHAWRGMRRKNPCIMGLSGCENQVARIYTSPLKSTFYRVTVHEKPGRSAVAI